MSTGNGIKDRPIGDTELHYDWVCVGGEPIRNTLVISFSRKRGNSRRVFDSF